MSDLITIEKEIKSFAYFPADGSTGKGEAVYGQLFLFPPRAKKHQIIFEDCGVELTFDFIFYGSNVEHLNVQKSNFPVSELLFLSKLFGLQPKTRGDSEDYYCCEIVGEKNYRAHIGFLKSKDAVYSVVYCKDGSTTFEEDKMVIHHLARVKLSPEFEQRLNFGVPH